MRMSMLVLALAAGLSQCDAPTPFTGFGDFYEQTLARLTPVRVGGGLRQPTKTRDVRPAYPARALTTRVQGVVIIEAIIDPAGSIANARILKSIEALDEAALSAVSRWQFTPTLLNGAPVAVLMTVTVNFTLQTDSTEAQGYANGVCAESPKVSDRPPDDPNASSFASPGATWYANGPRTLWAWWWGRMSDGGYKVLWVRPGQALNVTGQRLDAASAPLRADIPGGYFNSFQASGLYFPAAGCWQVDARASGQTLRFVVRIQ